jgi:hypothetical protein
MHSESNNRTAGSSDNYEFSKLQQATITGQALQKAKKEDCKGNANAFRTIGEQWARAVNAKSD